jgi:hypothetical protein
MSSTPRFKGVSVDLGGTIYVVPAMNAGTFEDFEDRIAALQGGRELKPVGLVVDLLHRCLRRNYPEIDRNVVREFVDLDNWGELFAIVMGESGYKQWAELEASQGNARALQILKAMTTPGTGAPSTPTLPPPSAGPSSTAAST